eukprot:m51a1_g13834 hypothetical protein (361) ;mRNA; f:500875-507672
MTCQSMDSAPVPDQRDSPTTPDGAAKALHKRATWWINVFWIMSIAGIALSLFPALKRMVGPLHGLLVHLALDFLWPAIVCMHECNASAAAASAKKVPPFPPLTLYKTRPWDERTARRLIASGAIAPLLAGLPEGGESLEECPICFLNYPMGLNRAKCCKHGICTECLLQIIHDPSKHNPALKCPFCNRSGFAVTYTGPLTSRQRQELEQERKQEEEAEQTARKVAEKQEVEMERERQEKRAEMELEDAFRSTGAVNADPATAVPPSTNAERGQHQHHHQHQHHQLDGGAGSSAFPFALGSNEARNALGALEAAVRLGSLALSEDQMLAIAVLQSLQDQYDYQQREEPADANDERGGNNSS